MGRQSLLSMGIIGPSPKPILPNCADFVILERFQMHYCKLMCMCLRIHNNVITVLVHANSDL